MSAAPQPSAGIAGISAYKVPRPLAPVDLKLDGNEGAPADPSLLSALVGQDPELLRRYPDKSLLEARLAALHRVKPEQVIVTAGGDDAIDRFCRATLGPGRELILPSPSFEMFDRYAALAGGAVVRVPWPPARFPSEAVAAAVTPRTAAIAFVTPNNPTGAAAHGPDLKRLSAAAPHALVLADFAYVEFAEEDLTPLALSLPNVIVLRTLSKAWGLAGVRIGYAVGPAEYIGWLRAAGGPYTVAAPSIRIASAALDLPIGEGSPFDRFVAQVRREREALVPLLRSLGARPEPSEANFVFVRFRDAALATWVRDALAGLGIAVRLFPGKADLDNALRITCPGEPRQFLRLVDALNAALAPEALLFDMDGVLADVSKSYRQAVIDTAAQYGVAVTTAQIAAAKAAGGANNDWELTTALLKRAGVDAPLAEVTARFEALYQGTAGKPGLRATEKLIPQAALLHRLAARMPLAVVTGRPRADAERFLSERGVARYFKQVVAMEDGPGKPDPAPVRAALERLGVMRAWMIGDNPDDQRAARAAGVVPIGIAAPQDTPADAARVLCSAGAARCLASLNDLEGPALGDLLP